MKVKYKLKKDLPNIKAGVLFTSEMYNRDGGEDADVEVLEYRDYEFRRDEIDNFNDWFEETQENNPLFEELTHDDQRDRVAVNIWFRKNRDGSHPKKMVDFIQFMKAVKAVSQDEGFMVTYKTLDKMVYGFGISRGWYDTVCAEREDHRIVAGQLYFDSEENAAISIESHPEEWETILNYNWGKGGDDE